MNDIDRRNAFDAQRFRIGARAFSETLDKHKMVLGDLKNDERTVAFYEELKTVKDEEPGPEDMF
jgi:hypothetical protein